MTDINKEIQQDVAIVVAAMTNIVSKAIAARLQGQKVDILEQHDAAKDTAQKVKAAETKAAPKKKAAPKATPEPAPEPTPEPTEAPKATPEPAPEPTPEPTEAPKVEKPKADAKADTEITDVTLRSKLQEVAKKFNPPAAFAILKEFNAAKVAQVSKDDYAALDARLDEKLASYVADEEDDF